MSRASYQSGVWGPEERTPSLPFSRSQPFDIIIMCDANCFKVKIFFGVNFPQLKFYIYLQIAINGQHFAEFIHRIPYQRATHVVVEGDLMLNHVAWEGGSGGGGVGGFAPPPPSTSCTNNLTDSYVILSATKPLIDLQVRCIQR